MKRTAYFYKLFDLFNNLFLELDGWGGVLYKELPEDSPEIKECNHEYFDMLLKLELVKHVNGKYVPEELNYRYFHNMMNEY